MMRAVDILLHGGMVQMIEQEHECHVMKAEANAI